jgi:aromatic-L-amino-acid/L-tryptophan decarboxylase
VTESSLFPPRAERSLIDDECVGRLAAEHEHQRRGPVAPTFEITEIRSQPACFGFAGPRSRGQTLAWVIEKMGHGSAHVTRQRYPGLFNPTPTWPADCAAVITAVLNPRRARRPPPSLLNLARNIVRGVVIHATAGSRLVI